MVKERRVRREAEGPAGGSTAVAAAGTTGLIWRQTELAWLAFRPDQAEVRGDPLTRPVDTETQELCVKLLELGGTEVVAQFDDSWSSGLILGCGKAVGPEGLTRLSGRPIQCHANSVAAWAGEPGRYRIQTGFGLSDGGWRRHTWLLDSGGRVVETTVPRELYFGMTLNDDLARLFYAFVMASQPAAGRRTLDGRGAASADQQPADQPGGEARKNTTTKTRHSGGRKRGRSPVVNMAVRDLDRLLGQLLEIDAAIRALPPGEQGDVAKGIEGKLWWFTSNSSSTAPPPVGFEGGPLANLASAVQEARDRLAEGLDAAQATAAGVAATSAQVWLGGIAARLRVGG
jgi:hypothetical protein